MGSSDGICAHREPRAGAALCPLPKGAQRCCHCPGSFPRIPTTPTTNPNTGKALPPPHPAANPPRGPVIVGRARHLPLLLAARGTLQLQLGSALSTAGELWAFALHRLTRSRTRSSGLFWGLGRSQGEGSKGMQWLQCSHFHSLQSRPPQQPGQSMRRAKPRNGRVLVSPPGMKTSHCLPEPQVLLGPLLISKPWDQP